MAAADTSLCSVRPDGGNDDDGVLETVARIGGKLESEGCGEAVVVESLRELQRVHMTFEALEVTKIGRAVNALRKTAPSEQARRLAAALYTGWKALADERFTSSRTLPPPKADQGIKKLSSSPPSMVDSKKQVAGPPEAVGEMAPTSSVVVEAMPAAKVQHHEVIDSAAIVRKPTSLRLRIVNINAPGKEEPRRVTVVRRTTPAAIPEAAPALNTRQNGGGSKQQAKCPATASQQGTNAAANRVSPTSAAAPLPSACKRKAEAPMVFDEARLAMARARLQERYNEVSAAKEKRKIKEIKGIDALRMEKKARARQRPAHYVRCTPAYRTGKQAPVTCPPRMPMAV